MVLWEALDALSHQFELCKISADIRVLVVLDADAPADQVSLIRAAVARSGAEALEVRTPEHPAANGANTLFAAAAAAADVIIDASGAQIYLDDREHDSRLVLRLSPIAPHHFPPHASLGGRVQKLVDLAASAAVLNVSDVNGTNLDISLDGSRTDFDHGVLAPEHPRAQFPAGWVGITPAKHTVRGQLVLMPGDANRSADQMISSPVVLHLVDDHISAIEGENADADVIRAVLEFAGDSAAYGAAEVCIGMNPGRLAAGLFDRRLLDPVVGRLLAGVVSVAFGHNLVADRPCNQRVAFALNARTVRIDDLPVVLDGQLEGDFAPDVYER